MYFVLATKFAYSKYFCKCSILIEHPCAQVPLDYTEVYDPELAQRDVLFFPLILCFRYFLILTSYSGFLHPILFSVVV